MATYTVTAKFSNGQVLRAHCPTSMAVGTYLPVELNGAVAATSEKTFKFKQNVQLVDLYTDQTAGQIEIVADDDPTGTMWATDAAIAATNNGRVTVPTTFRGGVTYKLLVRIAGAA